MYKWFVSRTIRGVFAANSRSDWSVALGKFADDVHFRFPGQNELSVELHDKQAAAEWFKTLRAVFPNLRFDVQQIVVSGWPWKTTACTRYIVNYTLPDGEKVANPGMQYLRIEWGKVTADHLYLDSQIVQSSIDRIRELHAGVTPDGAPR
jgi:ketosteroid isomerase-like protein